MNKPRIAGFVFSSADSEKSERIGAKFLLG
jgi:hypothetical protein